MGILRGTPESRCSDLLQPMGTLSTGARRKLVLALMKFLGVVPVQPWELPSSQAQ